MCKYHGKGNIIFDLTKKDQYPSFIRAAEADRHMYRLIGIINYDLLRVRPEIRKLKNLSLMLDESSMIQNETALRTKIIMKLDVENLILLSGTPVSGRYEKLYSQMSMLGMRMSKKAFWDKYINYRLWNPAPGVPAIKLVTGYKNVPDLKKQLSDLGAVFLKSDAVLNLPEQMTNEIKVNPPKQYDKFQKNLIVSIEEEKFVADTILKKLLYSRMLCGAYAKEKLTAFSDWVESTEDRLIVFYNFTAELVKLVKVCGKRPVSIVNGSQKDLTAYEKESNSITFIQYQAGAMGLNLQKANRIGYFSPPLSSELFEQSKKRIHRIGQKNTCFYYRFVCTDTVEEDIYNTLAKRQDYTERLFV